jgi:hypothetical protein
VKLFCSSGAQSFDPFAAQSFDPFAALPVDF